MSTASFSGVERLFYAETLDWQSPEGRHRYLEKILEEGDSDDLRLLAGRLDREEIVRWLEIYGGRRLSRRSRLFWRFLLDADIPEPHPLTHEIWPL